MTFPTITQVIETDNTSNVTTHNVDLPATIVSGDLIVVLGTSDSTSTPTTITKDDSTAGTFTELYNQHCLSATPSHAVGVGWIKVADGTEDGATLQPTTNEAQQSHWFSFIIPAAEWFGTIATGVDSVIQGGVVRSDPNPPNLATGWGALDILWIAGVHSDMSASPSISAYSEASNQNENSGTTGSGLIGFSSRENAVDTYNPGAYTLSAADQSYGSTIAIRPAAAAGINTIIIVPTGPPLS